MKTANGVEKPLEQWTLKEMSEFCDIHESVLYCMNCPFCYSCTKTPNGWLLEEKPKFTAQEIEDAKTLNRILLGGISSIGRGDSGTLSVSFDVNERFNDCSYACLSTELFPSIKNGKVYKFSEIIGGSNA